jgi:hypothetical protein
VKSILLLAFAGCSSLPAGFTKAEKTEEFSLLEKHITKHCRLETGGGSFSAVLTAPGVPALPMDAIWTEKSIGDVRFRAEISSPMGEPFVSFDLSDKKSFVNFPGEGESENAPIAGILKVIDTIGPQKLRGIVCGHHLVANSDNILKRTDSTHDFLLRSGLKSSRGTIAVETVTTLPRKIPGRTKGASVLMAGLFRTQEIGRLEWEGILRFEKVEPQKLTFTSSGQSFTLLFVDFD